MLDRWQRINDRGPQHYFLTRWPVWFVAIAAIFLGGVYAIDGNLHTLMQPRLAITFTIVLLAATFMVTRVAWRMIKPLRS